MSASKHAEAGLAAIDERKWDDAIVNLNKALEQSKSPAWLLARSRAYMEKQDYPRALRDAEYAYCTAAERGNDKSRKQMIEAQYRRSVVYFRQGRYADADMCAIYSQQLAKGVAVRQADVTANCVDENGMYFATEADVNPKTEEAEGSGKDKAAGAYDKVFKVMGDQNETKHPYDKDWKRAQAWRTTIIGFLEALDKNDPRRKVTVTLVPKKPSLDEKLVEDQQYDPEIEAAKSELTQKEVPVRPPTQGSEPFRNQMYQNDHSITVSLFMKFAGKEEAEKVQVDIQPNLITITNVPREPSTAFIVPHAVINPAKSTYRVATMKIEFTLAKSVPAKWPSFGREELSKPDASTLPLPAAGTSSSPAATTSTPNTTTSKGPAYPTSSRTGPKDWDHVAADGGDDEDDKDVDAFFKNLYKGATPDQQRAMMKSFQESNGTTLSTDWENVSKGTVETKPPEGVEAKKWSS